MADTGGKRITNTFRFKHHAIPVPETATNRIIDATTRLTATIAGIQDAPPDETEAIQSLCTLLLGKIAPPTPPTPRILPAPPPPTPLMNKDTPVIIWNPQLVQPSLPTHNHNTDNIVSDHNNPAIVEDDATKNHLSPVTAPTPLSNISFLITSPSSHTQSIKAMHCPY
jgi:hypothetical protein